MKLLPSRRRFCVQHTTMHQFTVRVTTGSHMRRANVCLAVTRHLHFWQNDWDLLRAVTRDGTDTEIRVSTEG